MTPTHTHKFLQNQQINDSRDSIAMLLIKCLDDEAMSRRILYAIISANWLNQIFTAAFFCFVFHMENEYRVLRREQNEGKQETAKLTKKMGEINVNK